MNKKESLKRQILSGWLSASILLTGSLVILLIFATSTAYAGPEITVSGQPWYISSSEFGAVTETGVSPDTHAGWTISGAPDGGEDILVKVTADSDWEASLGGDSGEDVFGLIATSTSPDHVITGSDTPLFEPLLENRQHDLKLKYTAPTATSVKSTTLTVQLTVPPESFFTYGRVFVTSTTYDGDLGGYTGANAECNARAAAGGLSGTWTAWLNSKNPASLACDRITNQAYYLVDGITRVTEDGDGLCDGGGIDHEINQTEIIPNTLSGTVWTGCKPDCGTLGTCQDNWENNFSGAAAACGLSSASDAEWTRRLPATPLCKCDETNHLYCFEN